MESIYKWARVTAGIFIGFLLLVCTTPFIIVAINGIDETTAPMMMTSTFFMIFLVLFGISFRFMDKNESVKRRRIGLGMLVTMCLSLFAYSLYMERQFQLQKETEAEKLQKIELMQKNIPEQVVISTALKGLIEDIEENEKELDIKPKEQ